MTSDFANHKRVCVKLIFIERTQIKLENGYHFSAEAEWHHENVTMKKKGGELEFYQISSFNGKNYHGNVG